jgi:predicted dehydrogenase
MSEKPVAHDVATANDLVGKYESVYAPRGLIWSVLENYRFESGIVRAAQLAGDDALVGPLALVEVRIHNPMPRTARFAKPGRTNQLIEGGCHFTAVLRAMVEGGRGVGSDAVVHTTGYVSSKSEYLEGPDTLAASYTFASGALGSLVVSYAVNKRRCEAMATGTKGGVFLERGVHDGKHGYRVVYEPHVEGAGAKIDEFHPFDGIAVAVGHFGAMVVQRLTGVDVVDDKRLSPAAAVVDIALVENVMRA